MSEKEIIYNFENIVEDSRTEDRKEYYESLRSVLELLKQQQKEIEELKKCYVIKPKELEKEINKEWQNKIKEKLNQIYEEYQEILNSNRNLYEKNVATFQHNAMRTVLEELLEE